ncbi:hypothetical protein Tco_1059528, partial [Tanacetum coccineum]
MIVEAIVLLNSFHGMEWFFIMVIEQLMAWSGMDMKMAKTYYHSHLIPQISFRCYIVKMGVLQIGISAMVIENKNNSDIEDAFFSMNILNYTSVSSDYFPASAGSRSFNSSKNSKDNMIPPVFSSFYNNPCLKDVQAIYAKELRISSPDPITPSVILTPSLMYLKHHEGQIEDILNYLDELYLHHIEKMEEGRIDRMIIRRNSDELKTELKKIRTQIIKLQKKRLGQKDKIAFAHYRISDLERIIEKIQALKRMPPKRTSISETPAITLDAIRQLTADFTTALEAQTAAMASASNLTGTPAV